MKCSECQNLILENKQDKTRMHLKTCVECRAFLEAQKTLSSFSPRMESAFTTFWNCREFCLGHKNIWGFTTGQVCARQYFSPRQPPGHRASSRITSMAVSQVGRMGAWLDFRNRRIV